MKGNTCLGFLLFIDDNFLIEKAMVIFLQIGDGKGEH